MTSEKQDQLFNTYAQEKKKKDLLQLIFWLVSLNLIYTGLHQRKL